MTFILGISAFYHDSAAALLRDGEIVAAVQEERFSREKYDPRFPQQSIEYCLEAAGITAEQLDFVAYYEQPLTKFERLIETYLAYAPAGFNSFRRALPVWLKQKLHLPHEIRRGLENRFRGRIFFPGHHESHAASAFFASPFEEAAIITTDGVGEWSTATYGFGCANRIDIQQEIRFPHSLGLLYSAFTYHCGFKVNSGEYKLMGLAPYGEPRYLDLIYEHLIDLKPDGSYHMDLSYFSYCEGLTMTSARFDELFGGTPRKADALLEQRHMDMAASVQKVCEEVMLRGARHAWEQTGRPENLVMAGGVALNCVANGRLLREGPFKNIWIQPAAGDAGGSLGAALFAWHQLLDKPRRACGRDIQQASYLGPQYHAREVKEFLDGAGARYHHLEDEAELLDEVAGEMNAGKVVGWFQGRAEFGPRALGARSIIGDARNPDLQSALNLKIKFRESFRPFAPCVLREHVQEWFDMRPHEDSPYMLLVAPVLERHRTRLSGEESETMARDPDLTRRVNVPRSTIPAVTHVDYSARVQTIDERHGRFRRLIEKFYEKTGCPVIVNTSFNLSWEPIVLTPAQAYHTFMQSEMDTLVLGDFILRKGEQPSGVSHWTAQSRPAPTHAVENESRGMLDPQFPLEAPARVEDRTLRSFAALCLCIFGLSFAVNLYRHGGAPDTFGWLALGLAIVVGIPGLIRPSLVRPVFITATAMTRPLGRVVNFLLLGAVYYLFLTPLAFIFRLRGRDVLNRRRPHVKSYWTPKQRPDDARRYLRQYQRQQAAIRGRGTQV
jgi:carbamoyltransferase